MSILPVLLLAVVAPAPAPQDPGALAREILGRERCQTELPGEIGPDFLSMDRMMGH